MSYHYPIYNLISGQECTKNANFGSRESFEQDIRVGTSAKNSHTIGTVSVSREINEDKTVTFRLWLDGTLIKRGTLAGQSFTCENA